MKDFKSRKQKRWLLFAVVAAGVGALGSGSTLQAAQVQPPSPSFTDKDGNTYTIGADGQVVKTAPQPKVDDPAFAAFTQWMEKYNAAAAPQKTQLEAEGVRLATARRAAMLELIQSNPQRAIELSIGLPQRQSLPTAVVQQLEEILQGQGENRLSASVLITPRSNGGADVQAGAPPKMTTTTMRSFSFNGKTYMPFFYGKRDGIMSKNDLPFYGVAIDANLAIAESPLRILAKDEVIPVNATPSESGTACVVCGKPAQSGIRGIAGTTLYYFDTMRDAEKFATRLEAEENGITLDEKGQK